MVTTDGVWRIQKREKVPFLEVFRLEETGHGDVLLPAFVDWRTNGLKKQEPHGENQDNSVNNKVNPP